MSNMDDISKRKHSEGASGYSGESDSTGSTEQNNYDTRTSNSVKQIKRLPVQIMYNHKPESETW